ncbi:MAG: hypothetical protein ACTSVA_07355 [Candidatus Njordarchaeales archaeon]
MRQNRVIFYFDRADRVLRLLRKMSISANYGLLCVAHQIPPRICPSKERFFTGAVLVCFTYRMLESVAADLLTMSGALAVILTLHLYGVYSKYMWPWHILASNKKIARLMLRKYSGKSFTMCVYCNLNNSFKNTQYKNQAVSLRDILNQRVSEPEFSQKLIANFDKIRNFYIKEPSVLRRYFEKFSILYGRTISIRLKDRDLRGECVGINDDGKLLLRTKEGIKVLSCLDIKCVKI